MRLLFLSFVSILSLSGLFSSPSAIASVSLAWVVEGEESFARPDPDRAARPAPSSAMSAEVSSESAHAVRSPHSTSLSNSFSRACFSGVLSRVHHFATAWVTYAVSFLERSRDHFFRTLSSDFDHLPTIIVAEEDLFPPSESRLRLTRAATKTIRNAVSSRARSGLNHFNPTLPDLQIEILTFLDDAAVRSFKRTSRRNYAMVEDYYRQFFDSFENNRFIPSPSYHPLFLSPVLDLVRETIMQMVDLNRQRSPHLTKSYTIELANTGERSATSYLLVWKLYLQFNWKQNRERTDFEFKSEALRIEAQIEALKPRKKLPPALDPLNGLLLMVPQRLALLRSLNDPLVNRYLAKFDSVEKLEAIGAARSNVSDRILSNPLTTVSPPVSSYLPALEALLSSH
jgi:hypothetical protein